MSADRQSDQDASRADLHGAIVPSSTVPPSRIPKQALLRQAAMAMAYDDAEQGDQQRVAHMSESERMREAAWHGAKDLPAEIVHQLIHSLPWIAGAWALSHLFGVGELLDLLGLAFLGLQAVSAVGHLVDFFQMSKNAYSSKDLERAGQHLAEAIATIGIVPFMGFVRNMKMLSGLGRQHSEAGPKTASAGAAGRAHAEAQARAQAEAQAAAQAQAQAQAAAQAKAQAAAQAEAQAAAAQAKAQAAAQAKAQAAAQAQAQAQAAAQGQGQGAAQAGAQAQAQGAAQGQAQGAAQAAAPKPSPAPSSDSRALQPSTQASAGDHASAPRSGPKGSLSPAAERIRSQAQQVLDEFNKGAAPEELLALAGAESPKKAYQIFASRLHPDRLEQLKDEATPELRALAEEAFKVVKMAYEGLEDPRMRDAYARSQGAAAPGVKYTPEEEQFLHEVVTVLMKVVRMQTVQEARVLLDEVHRLQERLRQINSPKLEEQIETLRNAETAILSSLHHSRGVNSAARPFTAGEKAALAGLVLLFLKACNDNHVAAVVAAAEEEKRKRQREAEAEEDSSLMLELELEAARRRQR